MRRAGREKVFGAAPGVPLDRNAKARIIVYARAWSARHRGPRQHRGPLTRATMEVLTVLLWGFHNSRDGRCFPSYERIAERAECNRDTVHRAIRALEAAGILTWVNRLARVRVQVADLAGRLSLAWKVIRTSNAYSFRDPLPCHVPVGDRRAPAPAGLAVSSKSESPPGTRIQDVHTSEAAVKIIVLDPRNELDAALIRLGRSGRFLETPQG